MMPQPPKISVILSTYRRNYGGLDCDNYLKRALDSILTQTFQDFELLLIDDGSSDGSEEICRDYAHRDSRIRYFRHEKNSGVPAKRYNEGILHSRGSFIAFMFDDDLWTPNALDDLYLGIRDLPSEYGMVFGVAEYCRKDFYGPNIAGINITLRSLFLGNWIANHSVLIKREVFRQTGGYDESSYLTRICDWDLWLRIARRYAFKHIPSKIGTITEGLSDSLYATVSINYHLANLRMCMIFRKIPLKNRYFPATRQEWRRVIFTFLPISYYVLLRYYSFLKLSLIKTLRGTPLYKPLRSLYRLKNHIFCRG